MSKYIDKSHKVTVVMYHLVFPAKYRKVEFDDTVEDILKEVCLDIEKRYMMSAPSKANISKLENPARVAANHRHGTKPCV